MNEEVQFIDAEARGGANNEKITFKDIVLSHLKKVGVFASVEMRGGFWEHKSHPNPNINETIDTYIPDSREVYSNAVEFLFDLLYAHFDKKMMEAAEVFGGELDSVYKENTKVVGSSKDSGFEFRKFKDGETKVVYRKERLKICRRMFRALCCFLKRKDYLKLGSFDEVE